MFPVRCSAEKRSHGYHVSWGNVASSAPSQSLQERGVNARRSPAEKKPAQPRLTSSFPSVRKTLDRLHTDCNSRDTAVPPARLEVPILCSTEGSTVDGVRPGWDEKRKQKDTSPQVGERNLLLAAEEPQPPTLRVVQAAWGCSVGTPK